MRRSFLWRGETMDKVYGGHSIINWPMTCRPKEKGGLGILDLERFARALRLCWLWFQWKHTKRAWNGLDLPVDRRDKELFAASTVVTVGDGKKARFWHSSWVDSATPKSIAPTLFKKAKRKKYVGPSGTEREPLDCSYIPTNHTAGDKGIRCFVGIGRAYTVAREHGG